MDPIPETIPKWDDNGDPITLAAAALDALEWLEWMRNYLTADKTTELDQVRANLGRCAYRLREQIDLANAETRRERSGIGSGPWLEESGNKSHDVRRKVLRSVAPCANTIPAMKTYTIKAPGKSLALLGRILSNGTFRSNTGLAIVLSGECARLGLDPKKIAANPDAAPVEVLGKLGTNPGGVVIEEQGKPAAYVAWGEKAALENRTRQVMKNDL
jgi:hypothetical protein